MIVPRLRRIVAVSCMMMLCVLLVPYIFQNSDTTVAGLYMVLMVPVLWYLVTCVLNYKRYGVPRIMGAAIRKRAWQFVASQVVAYEDEAGYALRVIFCQEVSKRERRLWVVVDAPRLSRFTQGKGYFKAYVFRVKKYSLEVPVAVCYIPISAQQFNERGVRKLYLSATLPFILRREWMSYRQLIKQGKFEAHKVDLRRLLFYVLKTHPLGGVKRFSPPR